LAFADAGASVAAADINESGALETAALIQARGGRAMGLRVDVSDETSTLAMGEKVALEFGGIDVLVNNASIYAGLERKPFFELEVAAWDRVMNVNLKGPWLCAKAVYAHLKASGAGKIINISSATVHSGSPNWAHYVSSKGGVIALTRAMAREAGDDGITVNAIAPGFTLTDASLSLIENAESYGVTRGALKRAQQPEDVVGAALFLASNASEFITGQTLIVDGGRQFN
jgi:NAD(P)-dependent dehydrogenase (short-subunit alcohol dehydrogenase family)